MTMRPAVQAIVDALLASSDTGSSISIDRVGEAVGITRIDTTEIEALLVALEKAERKVVVETGASGIAALRTVVPATRTLTTELRRKPTIDEIAAKTSLSVPDVRRALLLAQVMGRGR